MSINNSMAEQWVSDYYAGKSVGISTGAATIFPTLSTIRIDPRMEEERIKAQIESLQEQYKKMLAQQQKKDFVISLDGNIEDTKTIFGQAMDAAKEGYEVTIKVTK